MGVDFRRAPGPAPVATFLWVGSVQKGMAQRITLTDPDCNKIATPDAEGRVYLTRELAGDRVHVYAVRAGEEPDPDIEGAGEAIRNAMENADRETQQNLRAALAALGRAER